MSPTRYTEQDFTKYTKDAPKRCGAKQPRDLSKGQHGGQCGNYAGHYGQHNLLIPSNAPWFRRAKELS